MILPDGRAVLGLDALVGDTRPHDLRQAVDIDRVDAEPAFDLLAHRAGPGLGAENADLERGGPRVDAGALELLDNVEHVGGGDHDDARLEVEDQLDLPLGHPAAHRDDGAAQPLGAVVGAEAAGEQAVAVGDVADVARPAARGADRARHQVGPVVDVAARVADHGGLARGAAGGVDAHHLLPRHGEQAERVGVAQVGLLAERELGQILQADQVVGMNAGVPALGPVGSDVVVGVAHRPAQPFELQAAQLVRARGLDRFQPL